MWKIIRVPKNMVEDIKKLTKWSVFNLINSIFLTERVVR